MRRGTWIMTGTACLLAAALMASRSGTVVGDERDQQGQREAPPTQAPGAGEQATPDRAPADRDGGRPERNGRASLGVFLGPSPTTGARIQSVQPQSAAAQAGLRAGDFILSINDAKIDRPEDVQQTVSGLEPGREAEITIWRNGQTQQLTVMLGERRAAGFRGIDRDTAGGRGFEGRDGAAGWLGMTLGDTAEGVRIQRVAPEGPAARSGLLAGDVITGIDVDEVSRAGDLMRALQEYRPGEDVWLSIVRGDEEHAVKVTMADRPEISGSAGTREFRGFRGGFAGEAPDQATMSRLLEEHQQFAERIERLEAEVQALKSKLGARSPEEQNRPQPREE